MGRMRIFINGQELRTWTSASLNRKKSDMTGVLEVEIFYASVPSTPALTYAIQGSDVVVYIDDRLAFYGILDSREGRTVRQRRDARGRFMRGRATSAYGGELHLAIGQNGYSIRLAARGRTKYLIDCSHTNPTGTMLEASDRQAIEILTRDFHIDVDWSGRESPLNRIVLRDGAIVADEIFRICNEHCHSVFEGRDGRLRVVDNPTRRGEDLILGKNIMTFAAEQSENRANSEIIVRGHRNRRGIWGRDAVLTTEVRLRDRWVRNPSPLIVQLYGDANPASLRRRGQWEADRRASESKQIRIEVFDLGPQPGVPFNGEPWDIGLLHYVEVPVEGISTDFECIELTYRVDAQGTLNTELVLSPPPAANVTDGNSLLESNQGNSGRPGNESTTQESGNYPALWSSALLSVVPFPIAAASVAVSSLLSPNESMPTQGPPETLPQGTGQ